MHRYQTVDTANNSNVWQLEEYVTHHRPILDREASTASLVPKQGNSDNIIASKGINNNGAGYPLRRFYFRSIVGVVGPIAVSVYFITIWRVYLASLNTNTTVAFGPAGANWIFYSWFVAGVIGLNLSLYGLAGVEISMLMEPAWNVGNARRLMLHADKTWSGPGGWMKVLKQTVQMRTTNNQSILPSRLWFILALPSVLVFIAWPLSGLCLEMTEGYVHGTRGDGANVTGFSYANFNERNTDDAYSAAGVTWKYALDARIPGHGAVYSAPDFDRSQQSFLRSVPVVLPKNEGIQKLFLTAQAEVPIEGNAWGLLLQYNCSIVEKTSDLEILKDRQSASDNGILNSTLGFRSYSVQGNQSSVTVRNYTDTYSSEPRWAQNMYAVLETAYQIWPNKSAMDRLQSSGPNAIFTEGAQCYYNKNESITGDYPGINQERVFEIILWQQMFNSSYGTGSPPTYNFTIDHNITELHGAYSYADFNYKNPPNASANYPRFPMTAVGVKCKSSSSVGTADIDGVRSTYSNFVRTDTPINVQRSRCASRFGAETLEYLVAPYSNKEWLSDLFSSVAAPPLFYASYTDDPDDVDAGTGYMVQLSYLQASQLRQSMLRAYAAYAVQVMYNGGQGFTARDGSHVTSLNPNITSFVSSPVIKKGTMPAGLPVALFAMWAVMSTTLCVMYGFRRRWSEVLDGHTLFRLGVDLPQSDRDAVQQFSSAQDIVACSALGDIPGLVGDMDPGNAVGKIGLVARNAADKAKLYQ
ncbi:hypothetical protein BU24DRAFT_454114 [Aaosphaeria arxii CBS 175.79]|uniref:Uncharacterized protein n=1 Tax=Aaosphaeria arxii CBS 175.79 TaxID=1450172 RepID=A0A6A5XFJ5_9PLEO|nr:uncharacterized protein BU24DRAFT_454114 [Aaosphaeria arxii CBS 175.79]KAF2011601.1 hypothetical protein BU24DRAFT_454114 [Aaosphaeria arxii CBS 175.79]